MAAGIIRRAVEAGVEVRAGLVQGDDGVLISNRLPTPLPFVDEVSHVEKVPLDMLAAVEVAPQGHLGPTNAVATGLIINYCRRRGEET